MHKEKEKKYFNLAPLCVLAVLCIAAVVIANNLARESISFNQQAERLKIIKEVMTLRHDNDLVSDRIEVKDKSFINPGLPVVVYRARRNGRPVGVVFMPVRARGYNGIIDLVIGISYAGELTGVRIRDHKETEGLGDQVHQDNSDWIYGFNQRSLANTRPGAWTVRGDGGDFDQLSGATITPRGIINAVKYTLEYYEINKENLF